MTHLQRRIYGAVIRLHPAAFREEFGSEMAHDCEDAVHARGFAPLLGDAIVSLARQWKLTALAPREAAQPVASHPFLAGQYFMVDQGHLNLFDLACASVLSLMLFFVVGFAANLPNQHATSVQAVESSHDGGIDNASHGPSFAASNQGRQEAATTSASGYRVSPTHGIVRLGHRRGFGGWSLRSELRGGSPTSGTLAAALQQWVIITGIIWLTSFFFRRSPGIGKRVVLTALGLLAIAASVAFASIPKPPIHAQILHATTPLPSFEVATIKLIKDGKYAFRQGGPDEVYILGRTARFLIGDSYNLPPGSKDRLQGEPDWLDTNEYQVDAKIETSVAAAMQKMPKEEQINQRRLLMQSLLAERFKLKVHFETRDLPVYALVIAKGGPKLTHAKDLPPLDPAQPYRPRNVDDMRGSLMIVPKGGPMFEMIVKGETLDQFAGMLTPHPEIGGRPVVNQTGLSGAFDFTMDWTREQAAGSASDAGGPGLFAALEQQLGLKLVSTKAPIEVVIIDHIELPSEN